MENRQEKLVNICEELKEIFIESLGIELTKNEIDGTDLINELSINSIDALEILVQVENTYDIIIPDEDLSAELISSLEGFASYIINRIDI